MRKTTKAGLALPALTAASLLVAGCSAPSPSGASAAPGGGAEAASATPPAPAEQPQLVVKAAPEGGGTPSAVARPTGGGRQAEKTALKVASYDRATGRAVISGATHGRPPGQPGGAHPSASAPAGSAAPADKAPGRPSAGHAPEGTAPGGDSPAGGPADGKSPDRQAPSGSSPAEHAPGPKSPDGKAPAGSAPAGTAPSGSAPAPHAPSADAPVAVGDIIASAPTPGAPDGVLAKVTQVLGTTSRGTEVATAPATLGALLGDAKADGTVPVDPSAVRVEPLVKGAKVSWAKTGGLHFGPEGARLPLGSLRIDVGAALPTVQGAAGSASASASGFVQLAPEVDFSYDGRGTPAGGSPGTASLALSGTWSSQWELKGRAAGGTGGKPLRVPFAKLHASPVIQVGPVPVVVNLGLTCYLQVDADGRIDLDVKQDVKGDFKVGGSYSRAKGWTPVNSSGISATSPSATVSAAGKVKATLGAEANVGLYGTVGVSADVAPYLRAEAEGRASGALDGSGSAVGTWKALGGLDVSGALQVQLKIFDTPVFQKPIPLGTLHREWQLAAGEGSVPARGGRRT
ncbi:hypothetical protein ACFP1Z_16130 [Streptomyces gamaensis]|uniref:Lipoprotein n=1 Tax=Streptomyces gamaensis TaxID=1763542 RepID=A0ABW0YYN0_9ACTN